MFEDLETETRPIEKDKPSWWMGRWAHFPALLVFGLLFFLLHGYPWRWHVAIGGSYTVYVFLFAFGSSLGSADDFFGDPRVSRYAVKLLIPHALVLALIVFGVCSWFYLRTILPSWVTQEGHKGSLWDLFGWLLLAGAAIAQGFWMAGRIKRRLGEAVD